MQYRLRSKADFDRLRQEGRVFHNRFVTLSVASNGLDYNRYGIITSKQLGKAVRRNRVRRLLREAIRHAHARLRSGFDVVLIARHEIVGQPFLMICRTLDELFRKAGLVEEL